MYTRALSLFILALLIALPTVVAQQGQFFHRVEAAVEQLVALRRDVNDNYQLLLNTQTAAADATEELAPIELSIATLEEQIAAMTTATDNTEKRIADLEREMSFIADELAEQLTEKEDLSLAVDETKTVLRELLRVLHDTRSSYRDPVSGEVSMLSFVLGGGSAAELTTREENLQTLVDLAAKMTDELAAREAAYKEAQTNLLSLKGKYTLLRYELGREREQLDTLLTAKTDLLEETRGEEARYKELLVEAEADQAAVLADLATAKEDIATISEKLIQLEETVGEDHFAEILAEQGVGELSSVLFPGHVPRLAWPVSPERGVTAFFKDQEYEEIFGVTHNAVDVRLRQGSSVHAAGPGVVVSVHENGTHYAYVMLAHGDELMTVYGHLSDIFVEKGDIVRAGDIIAHSGGTPGTHGAGLMTTGPHLHFEVFDRGEHVDPLGYLPLEPMRVEDVPERFFVSDLN